MQRQIAQAYPDTEIVHTLCAKLSWLHLLEKDLEDAILREIELFLLELGVVFTFMARQRVRRVFMSEQTRSERKTQRGILSRIPDFG